MQKNKHWHTVNVMLMNVQSIIFLAGIGRNIAVPSSLTREYVDRPPPHLNNGLQTQFARH